MGGKMFRSLICNWRHHSNCGFTLIEVIVVMVLVGALTLTAMPLFRHWSHQTLARSAAQDVTNLLYQARAKAINSNVEYHVKCDFDNDDCVLEEKDRLTATWVATGGPISFADSIDLKGTKNCDVVSGTSLIEFNPNGTCNELYFCITEVNSGEVFKIGTVDSVTGRINVIQ